MESDCGDDGFKVPKSVPHLLSGVIAGGLLSLPGELSSRKRTELCPEYMARKMMKQPIDLPS